MSKKLEFVGFALVGGMIYAFLGLMAQGDPMGQYIFWSCAVGTLGIILYRKQKRKKDLFLESLSRVVGVLVSNTIFQLILKKRMMIFNITIF